MPKISLQITSSVMIHQKIPPKCTVVPLITLYPHNVSLLYTCAIIKVLKIHPNTTFTITLIQLTIHLGPAKADKAVA